MLEDFDLELEVEIIKSECIKLENISANFYVSKLVFYRSKLEQP